MELRQLVYFVAVADEGGFARAAQRLHIVQPAVSQQVRRLERELNVQLFDRSTRHVRLTAAGERLLPEAREIVAGTERVRRLAAEIAHEQESVLRLSAGPALGEAALAVLDRLRTSEPPVRVRMSKLGLAERLDAVRAGTAHAALVRILAAAPGLEMVPLWTEPLYVALPATHPLAAAPEVGLEDLAEMPVRLAPRERNPPFVDLMRRAFRSAGISPPMGPEFTNLHDTLTDLAEAGPSWTVFYRVGQPPEVTGVVYRELGEPAATTYLAVPPGPPAEPVRRLLDAAASADRAQRR
ncbi:DNA-binding transcriptional LysR family regulator [Haloactinopolyspora alba]|uniref:DNA-binding transcriptional LysR family regulator n=1 Tax=Haloactinopolyspora alba TaxID=648780 RepID=A0A2P8E2A4_9ACTN|nr:LysR family transcriptional regulator [Haloactinopolyspora alba]PSL03582.1 DNA-binding transcriptional LysR family regulator [Haloactinopolyspora alba]